MNRIGRELDSPPRAVASGETKGFAMKMGLILAAAAALLVSGCGMAGCDGAATNGAAAGGCGLHTTFFAARTGNEQAPTFRKS